MRRVFVTWRQSWSSLPWVRSVQIYAHQYSLTNQATTKQCQDWTSETGINLGGLFAASLCHRNQTTSRPPSGMNRTTAAQLICPINHLVWQ